MIVGSLGSLRTLRVVLPPFREKNSEVLQKSIQSPATPDVSLGCSLMFSGHVPPLVRNPPVPRKTLSFRTPLGNKVQAEGFFSSSSWLQGRGDEGVVAAFAACSFLLSSSDDCMAALAALV